jgi:hypothetical protein
MGACVCEKEKLDTQSFFTFNHPSLSIFVLFLQR